jgi:Transglutaminase-like superfamily/SLA1 homology domain 1, SHD1
MVTNLKAPQLTFLRVGLAALLVALSGCLFGQEDVARSWSDTTGSYKIEAVLVGQDDTSVQLRRIDNGDVVTVPLEKLSAGDREYLNGLAKPSPADPAVTVDTAPWLTKTGWVVYRVNMKATLTIPAHRELKLLRMRHALPTPRPWSASDEQSPGATNIRISPETGKQKFDSRSDSHFVIYDLKKGIDPGSAHEFMTSFDVVSCDREFDPSASQSAWDDYDKPKRNPEPTMLPPDLKAWIAGLKAEHSPAELVAKVCEWNVTNMTYDASVSFPSSAVGQFLAAKRGHCGHYCELTGEFCREAGIPTRRVFGLNLYEEDGDSELSAIRSDYTNVHTWIEVWLPKEGWIELEPADAENPFRIPARFVQNNPEIQNYELAFKTGGQLETHRYQPSGNGAFSSEFGFGNLITYSVGKIDDPRSAPKTAAGHSAGSGQ